MNQNGVVIQFARLFKMSIVFFEYMLQPRFWIAHDEHGYWLVPAKEGGWHERSPFVGHAINLIPLVDFDGIDLDLPDEEKTY